MTHSTTSGMANRLPTSHEIHIETLGLDGYGMIAQECVGKYPVCLSTWMRTQDLLEPLTERMAEEGWEFAGSGFFSAVYVKHGLALKFGFKVTDTGSMYAAWCRANQGKTGVPSVYSLSKFKGCYVVLMRRYTPLHKDWLNEDSQDFIPALHDEFIAVQHAVNNGGTYGLTRFDTVRIGLQIHDFFKGVVDFDLGRNNVMLDDGDNLIITDPVSWGACSEYNDGSYYTTEFQSYSFT